MRLSAEQCNVDVCTWQQAARRSDALGGILDAAPREDGGSVFWLNLPLSTAPVQTTDEVTTDPVDRLRVLVADDHPTNRRIVEMMLESVADVTTAEDGVEAVEAAGRGGDIDRLTLPIGGAAVRDKRPEVIAALTAAELATCLLSSQQEIVIDRFAAASARCNSAPVRSTR